MDTGGMDACGESPGWRDGTVWGRSLAPGAACTEAAEPQTHRAARPASRGEREAEPGLLAEVPGRSGAGVEGGEHRV